VELGATAHRKLEGLPVFFTALTAIAVLVGSVIELVPTFFSADYAPVNARIQPYTALQLHGRDLYVREGCYNCHSQMIRPLLWETKRYGDFSRAEESIHDRPFQWGSKRTGPDLARVGAKYPDLWHYRHLGDPREVVPGSIMPAYPWLFRDKTDFGGLSRKLAVMKSLGVPYDDEHVKWAEKDARREAKGIAAGLVAHGAAEGIEDKEIVPLIAYLQRLGADYRKGLIK
jgi:cytochrome c oxidase cbb3-type subunit I/II